METLVIPVRDDAREFPRYDRGREFIDLLAGLGANVQGRRVAELGAGYGSIARAAARAGAAQVYALDVQGERIEEAARRAGAEGFSVEPIRANLLDPPPDLPQVDLALLIGVVEYAGLWDETEPVESLQRRVFETAYQMLAPGGTLIVGTKNRLWPTFALRDVHTRRPLVNILPRPLADRLSRRFDGAPYRHHLHTPRGWVNLLREAGFSRVECSYPYFSYQFPLLAVDRPRFGDIPHLWRHDVPPDVARAVYGRFPRLKAYAIAAAAAAGLPLTHSVLLKAQK